MKIKIITFILLFAPFIVFAKGTIVKGKVVEKQNSGEVIPLAGASIFWKKMKM